jgi:hypothetical protein
MIRDDKFIRSDINDPEVIFNQKINDITKLAGIGQSDWSRTAVQKDDPLPAGTLVEFIIPDGTKLQGKVAAKAGGDYIIEMNPGESYLIPPGKLTRIETSIEDIKQAVYQNIPNLEILTEPTIQVQNRCVARVAYKKRPTDSELTAWASKYYPNLRLVDALDGENRELGLIFEITAAEDVKPQGGDPETRGKGLERESIPGTGEIGYTAQPQSMADVGQAPAPVPAGGGWESTDITGLPMPEQAEIDLYTTGHEDQAYAEYRRRTGAELAQAAKVFSENVGAIPTPEENIQRMAQMGQPGDGERYQDLVDAAKWVIARFNDSNEEYFALPSDIDVAGDEINRIVRISFILNKRDGEHLYMSRGGAILPEGKTEEGMDHVRGYVQVDSDLNLPMMMLNTPEGPESIQKFNFDLTARYKMAMDVGDLALKIYYATPTSEELRKLIEASNVFYETDLEFDPHRSIDSIAQALLRSQQFKSVMENYFGVVSTPKPVKEEGAERPEIPVSGYDPKQTYEMTPEEQEQYSKVQAYKTANYEACATLASDVLSSHGGYTADAQADFDARLTKLAVDPGAKKYWSKYFKDYGKMLTRDIPRKKHEAKRTASFKKNAVDEYAKRYWIDYFGSGEYNDAWYGKDLVRDIEEIKIAGESVTFKDFRIAYQNAIKKHAQEQPPVRAPSVRKRRQRQEPRPDFERMVTLAQWAIDAGEKDPKFGHKINSIIFQFLGKYPNFLSEKLGKSHYTDMDWEDHIYTLSFAISEQPRLFRELNTQMSKWYSRWRKQEPLEEEPQPGFFERMFGPKKPKRPKEEVEPTGLEFEEPEIGAPPEEVVAPEPPKPPKPSAPAQPPPPPQEEEPIEVSEEELEVIEEPEPVPQPPPAPEEAPQPPQYSSVLEKEPSAQEKHIYDQIYTLLEQVPNLETSAPYSGMKLKDIIKRDPDYANEILKAEIGEGNLEKLWAALAGMGYSRHPKTRKRKEPKAPKEEVKPAPVEEEPEKEEPEEPEEVKPVEEPTVEEPAPEPEKERKVTKAPVPQEPSTKIEPPTEAGPPEIPGEYKITEGSFKGKSLDNAFKEIARSKDQKQLGTLMNYMAANEGTYNIMLSYLEESPLPDDSINTLINFLNQKRSNITGETEEKVEREVEQLQEEQEEMAPVEEAAEEWRKEKVEPEKEKPSLEEALKFKFESGQFKGLNIPDALTIAKSDPESFNDLIFTLMIEHDKEFLAYIGAQFPDKLESWKDRVEQAKAAKGSEMRNAKTAAGPWSYNPAGKDDKKDFEHKEHNAQPSKLRTRFDITRMYSTTSAQDNGYVIVELSWDPAAFKGMGDRNIMHQIISYLKGVESDKHFHDLGVMGRPRIMDMDTDAGVARAKIRCSETRGLITLTYTGDEALPIEGIY